jgi:anti-sigma-K factor RskA
VGGTAVPFEGVEKRIDKKLFLMYINSRTKQQNNKTTKRLGSNRIAVTATAIAIATATAIVIVIVIVIVIAIAIGRYKR